MASRLGLKTLGTFSRQMSTMLEAGLPIRRALAIVERQTRSAQRQICSRLGMEIESGHTFTEALERQGCAFPVLYHRLIKVGETVGGLGKVLSQLADYYDFVRSMWVRLLTRLIYPVCLYFTLILVLAVIAYFQAMFADDPLAGYKAARILAIGLVIFVVPIVLYFALTRLLGGLRPIHELIIRVPMIGRIFRTLAIARFSWSMELMTEAGVRIFDSVTWSLQATGNAAYAARAPKIVAELENGVDLHDSLSATGLFPHDYIEMLHVASESGSMPDIFRRLARNYFERADFQIKAATTAVFWTIYALVAAVIIFYYISMVLKFIINPIKNLT